MDDGDAEGEARELIQRVGAQEAWRLLTSRAIEHHLSGHIAERENVQQVLAALHRLASSQPAPPDRD